MICTLGRRAVKSSKEPLAGVFRVEHSVLIFNGKVGPETTNSWRDVPDFQ
jgi:hypothetical protein